MKGNDIINRARTELKDFIVFEGKLLARKLGMNNIDYDGHTEFIFEISDLGNNILVVGVEVDTLYMENSGTENRYISEVHITSDDDIYIIADDEENKVTISWEKLSTDELVMIANAFEKTYLNK